MEIIRLPFGEFAPPEADCLRLYRRPDGGVHLEGSLLHEDESLTMIGDAPYPDEAEAEAAGLAWANGCDVDVLYVVRLTEADRDPAVPGPEG